MEDIQFQKNCSAFINPAYPVNPSQANTQTQGAGKSSSNSEFGQLLRQTIQQKQQLVFSKHAQQRIDSRQIQISPQLMTQMNNAVEQASGKGIKDALMISGQTAFIVNVPSRTVVTTMSGQEMTNNIFTNIDGAVIL